MITDALRLSVFFGESVTVGSRPAGAALMDGLADRRIVGAALLRGLEGFGINRRIHAERLPDISTDLPLVAVAVDTADRIRAVLDDIAAAVPRGLVTLERVRLATGDDVARAGFPPGDGGAVVLSILCRAGERTGRRAAYREAVALLRQSGASGAIVLPGVDGVLAGRRGRARLFSANADTPMVIVSVGPPEPLARALPRIGELFAEPVATLERVARVKHDGAHLDPLPRVDPAGAGGADVWMAIALYTRRTAHVGSDALYSELTRRVRAAGGAGTTTILGDWGFSSDEQPHGDRLGRVASHRPTYTVYIDRPEKVLELWPMIDALTVDHGIVTAALVPGYRERAGDVTHGRLGVT